jgi:hypothetical protein
VPGADIDLSGIRIHLLSEQGSSMLRGAIAAAKGADIYFRAGCFAPDTRAGLWVLAHEVAHVVQQHLGHGAVPRADVAEQEANAAAFAAIAGRTFSFGAPRTGRAGKPIVQEFMGWEHLLLGSLAPADLGSGADDAIAHVAELAAELNRCEQVDPVQLRERLHGLHTVRLSGSGLVVTLGELNILPDYLSHPADIDAAPASFVLPLVRAIRTQNHRELARLAGWRGPARRSAGELNYPAARVLPGIREAIQIDALGRGCELQPSERYLSVLSRNACHFAPFSWHRWRSFHLLARQMIAESDTASGADRQQLRSAAQVYAGYADHFLHDSFAAGHLANKTLVMQWYVEWILGRGGLLRDRALLAEVTYSRQPYLYGPALYDSQPDHVGTDPQSANEAPTLEERIALSGVRGDLPGQRLRAYACYLTLLRSSVAQLSAGVVHDYFSKRPLIVASRPDGPRFQLRGDHTMLADGAWPMQAAAAACLSRRAIDDLLETGQTGITCSQIFDSMPRYVEVDGELMPLPRWHDERLRELCFTKLFRLPGTRARKLLLSLASPFFGMPSADYDVVLRTRRSGNTTR